MTKKPTIKITKSEQAYPESWDVTLNGEHIGEIVKERSFRGVSKKLYLNGTYAGIVTNQKDAKEFIGCLIEEDKLKEY